MEQRNGWHRAVLAARAGFRVTVLYCPGSTDLADYLLQTRLPDELKGWIQFLPVRLPKSQQRWMDFEPTFYAAYRQWHRLAFKLASELHRENSFALVHTVTLCGFREPGFAWTMGIPHVWGPLGGTHCFPKAFLGLLEWKDRVREVARSCLNWVQLHAIPRIKQASRKSVSVIAATHAAQQALENSFGVPVLKELETGIESVRSTPRQPRMPNQPLNILWAGRLRGWKALPILLFALARLPKEQSFCLRVLGDGSCLKPWQKLANELGISRHVEWLAWPAYRETLPHYCWADIFAFTSLRDTSGTGLLEAMAAGCPIVSVDHQGAADIVDETCGMLVPVVDSDKTAQGFADAISLLHNSPVLWKKLSDGALVRAQGYLWEARLDWTKSLYRSILADVGQEMNRKLPRFPSENPCL